MAELVLSARGLSRRFGGLYANKDVSLDMHKGVLHAVLGPNGAGKSTLINLLSGDLPPSGGQILLRGQDISGWSPDRRSRNGIGRSYQRTNIFPGFTVFENCRLAAQSRTPRALHIFSHATGYADLCEAADKAIGQAGLAARRDVVAGTLSHGEQRQLEIAMVLATAPSVLLLDEPLAGMGPEESQAMVALLKKLTPDHAILLVEHDMDAVFAVADVITVMVTGQVLESGSPEQIRESVAVQGAYLGAGEPDDE
ncbi:ABC transporter ATP-binding protein [Azoarcus sp. DN11]|uniref:ABC transporter ATP-binding protein n=1 Tax=Azoarcus sp. DN11 TaxID=356837 RepID=UPI000EAC4264|nr:ABC transporter ATP-binding protein [Azoarcus sp. DN11]AYH44112.1 ABC transporter ATP-binding protein [Azoarcus sp. DN11]